MVGFNILTFSRNRIYNLNIYYTIKLWYLAHDGSVPEIKFQEGRLWLKQLIPVSNSACQHVPQTLLYC